MGLALRGAEGQQVRSLSTSQVNEWNVWTAWLSIGGNRQGAASRQMPNPSERRRNRCLSPQYKGTPPKTREAAISAANS